MSDFVDFNLAKKLKEKGYPQKYFGKYSMAGACYFKDGRFYKEGCIAIVEDCFTAPMIHQVLKWLREEKEIHIEVHIAFNKYFYEIYDTTEYDKSFGIQKSLHLGVDGYNKYEESAIAGIEYVLDNLI